MTQESENNELEVSDMYGNRYKCKTIEEADVLQIIEKYENVAAWMPLPEPYVPGMNVENIAESE